MFDLFAGSTCVYDVPASLRSSEHPSKRILSPVSPAVFQYRCMCPPSPPTTPRRCHRPD